jgi:hypothetical protein
MRGTRVVRVCDDAKRGIPFKKPEKPKTKYKIMKKKSNSKFTRKM